MRSTPRNGWPSILLVDVDGVLVRGRPEDGKPWASRLADDLGMDAEELHRTFFHVHWQDVVLGRAALRDRLAPVLERIAPAVSCDDLIAYWFGNDARLDERLLEDLSVLRARGVRVHLASNQEHERAAYLTETLGLRRYIDGIHYSAALGCRKPDQAFFGAVTSATGAAGIDLFLVDDSPENVEAAKAAGWGAALWTGEERLPDLLERGLSSGSRWS